MKSRVYNPYYLPTYARRAQREIQRYDRFLRIRWSTDQPDLYILERKTNRWYWPDGIELGTDHAIQYNDGMRMVTLLEPPDLPYVTTYLRLNDIQARGGAKDVARELDAHDDRVADLIARHQVSELEALASEAYDQLAWLEQRRVAVGGG